MVLDLFIILQIAPHSLLIISCSYLTHIINSYVADDKRKKLSKMFEDLNTLWNRFPSKWFGWLSNRDEDNVWLTILISSEINWGYGKAIWNYSKYNKLARAWRWFETMGIYQKSEKLYYFMKYNKLCICIYHQWYHIEIML